MMIQGEPSLTLNDYQNLVKIVQRVVPTDFDEAEVAVMLKHKLAACAHFTQQKQQQAAIDAAVAKELEQSGNDIPTDD